MGEVEDAVDALELACESLAGLLDDLLDDAVDATYGGDDPDLVADAYLSVGALVALEGELLAAGLLLLEALELDV